MRRNKWRSVSENRVIATVFVILKIEEEMTSYLEGDEPAWQERLTCVPLATLLSLLLCLKALHAIGIVLKYVFPMCD